MKYKYVYKDKNTNRKIYSEVKLTDPNLILVAHHGNSMIKNSDVNVIKK